MPQPHLPTLKLCWERVCVEAQGQVTREAVERAEAISVYTFSRRGEDVLKVLVIRYTNPDGQSVVSAHATVLQGARGSLASRVVQYLEARGFRRASEGYLAFEGSLPKEFFRELCRALGINATAITMKKSRTMGWRAFAEGIHSGFYDRVEIRPPEVVLEAQHL